MGRNQHLSTMSLKIAIFRALYLGDMLCAIPAIRAIRNAYPRGHICLIGLPWQTAFASRFSSYFNDFVTFPGWPGLPEQVPDGRKIVSFLNDMQSRQFDIVFQMHGNGVLTNSLCMLWGGKVTCGLRQPGAYAPDETHFPSSDDGEHEIRRFLKLPQCLGIPAHDTHLEFPLAEADTVVFEKIAGKTGISPGGYICLHPGARDPKRRWSVENFARVANNMSVHGFPVVLTGSIEEKALLRRLQSLISGPVINIVETFGHLTAGALAALLAHARLLVSNDTGVSHIAAALHVPSVILFSPYSDFKRWRPLDTQTHLAIPFEQTSDVNYVMSCVEEKLCDATGIDLSPLRR